MTEDPNRNKGLAENPLAHPGADTASTLLGGGSSHSELSLASINAAAAKQTPDRGYIYGAIKGGTGAISHLVTDPIVMVSSKENLENTFTGFKTLLTRPDKVATQMWASAQETIKSGNTENIGSMFGSTVVNAAMIGTAARGVYGSMTGMREASTFTRATTLDTEVAASSRPFNAATKFETPVAARTQMLQSVEGTAVKPNLTELSKPLTAETLAEQSVRMRAAQGTVTEANAGAKLVDDFMHAKPNGAHVELPPRAGTARVDLPELKFGEPGNVVHGRPISFTAESRAFVSEGTGVTGGRLAETGRVVETGKVVETGRLAEGGRVAETGRLAEGGRVLEGNGTSTGRLLEGNGTGTGAGTGTGKLSEGVRITEGNSGGVLSHLDDTAGMGRGNLISAVEREGATSFRQVGPRRSFSEGDLMKLREDLKPHIEAARPHVESGKLEMFTNTAERYMAGRATVEEVSTAFNRMTEGTALPKNVVSEIQTLMERNLGLRAESLSAPVGTLRTQPATERARSGASTDPVVTERPVGERPVGERPVGERPVGERPATGETSTIGERPVVTNERPVVANERPVVSNERPVVANERPVVSNERPVATNERVATVTERPPVEQPTWRATEQRIGQQLDEMRAAVREANGNVRLVDKVDDAVRAYSKEPTAENLSNLNKSLREVERTAPGVSERIAPQVNEIRQSMYQHMPAEQQVLARIEARAATESRAAARISEDVQTGVKNMRQANNVEDLLKESRQLETKVTKYLTEEVRAGRMTAEEALEVRQATTTLTQETRQAAVQAMREQAAMPKFKTEPVVEPKAAEVRVTEPKPTVVEGKPAVVEGKPAVVEGKPAVVDGKPAIEGKPTVVEAKATTDAAAIRTQVATETLGPRAAEYNAKATAATESYKQLINATDDAARVRAATEFRMNAAEANSIVKEATGVSKAAADTLKFDIPATLQQARVVQAGDQLVRVTQASNTFVDVAERAVVQAVREGRITEPAKLLEIRSGLQTFESHVSGLSSTNTPWGTNAGTKAITTHMEALEKTFTNAGIDFAPLRAHYAESVTPALEGLRNARQATAIGDTFFSPVRQFALEHPMVGRPVDFLWNNPKMLTAYSALGVVQVKAGFEALGDFMNRREQQQAASEARNATKSADATTNGATTYTVREATAPKADATSTTKETGSSGTTGSAEPQGVQRTADKGTAQPVVDTTRVAAAPTLGQQTEVRRQEAAFVAAAATQANEIKATQANGSIVTDSRATADGRVNPEVLKTASVSDQMKVAADPKLSSYAQTGSLSYALFSMPTSAEQRRLMNQQMHGGLDVGFVYYAKSPGASVPVEETRSVPVSNANGLPLRNNFTDIPEREKTGYTRFDWTRTRLDANSLSRPEGFYVSNSAMGPDGRRFAGGGGSGRQDQNGANGTFAKKYPFLAQAAEAAKGGNASGPVTAGMENTEALNPDQTGSGATQPSMVAYQPSITGNDPDPSSAAGVNISSNAASVQSGTQDEDQSVALT